MTMIQKGADNQTVVLAKCASDNEVMGCNMLAVNKCSVQTNDTKTGTFLELCCCNTGDSCNHTPYADGVQSMSGSSAVHIQSASEHDEMVKSQQQQSNNATATNSTLLCESKQTVITAEYVSTTHENGATCTATGGTAGGWCMTMTMTQKENNLKTVQTQCVSDNGVMLCNMYAANKCFVQLNDTKTISEVCCCNTGDSCNHTPYADGVHSVSGSSTVHIQSASEHDQMVKSQQQQNNNATATTGSKATDGPRKSSARNVYHFVMHIFTLVFISFVLC